MHTRTFGACEAARTSGSLIPGTISSECSREQKVARRPQARRVDHVTNDMISEPTADLQIRNLRPFLLAWKHSASETFSSQPKEDPKWRRKRLKKLDELFHDTLKDIYFAEKKILATLPKMEKAAHAHELKRAFAKHRTETQGHVDRLEKVFADHRQEAAGQDLRRHRWHHR